jgi:translation initiation factor IF-2
MSKIKRLDDFLGKSVKDLTFSAPARAWGFTNLPTVGSAFKTFADKSEAENYLARCRSKLADVACRAATNLPEGAIEIPIVLKSDVAGSLEAIERELGKISNDRTVLRVILSGVGAITENDIKIASGSVNSLVIGFNTKVDGAAKDLAAKYNIPIATFNIIYKLGEWVVDEAKKREIKVTVVETTGKAKVLKFFSQMKDRQVIGGEVKEGKLEKNREIRIIRREAEVGRGKIIELQEQKIKVSKVEAGTQFGAQIESKITLAPGDFIEAFDLVTK